VASRRERPTIRLLFDELLPPGVARALNELGFRTSHVGHEGHGQPPRGFDDATVLDHAAATRQVVVTFNHDMIMLCAERRQPVVWLDPRGRQFRHDELAAAAFAGIATWHRLLASHDEPVCVRVLRTKVEAVSLARAATLAENRMRTLRARARRRRAAAEVPGQLRTDR
jgi:predicted nuclease of predicted toxin-antitoxin system